MLNQQIINYALSAFVQIFFFRLSFQIFTGEVHPLLASVAADHPLCLDCRTDAALPDFSGFAEKIGHF